MEKRNNSAKGWTLVRWLFAAAFIIAVIISGRFSGLTSRTGLLFIVFGTAATALMGFKGSEIAAAIKHAIGPAPDEAGIAKSAHFWESAARNAWILGALGSALNFTIVLAVGSDGIQGVALRMIQAFLVMLYGLVLAVILLVPAVKLAGQAEKRRRGDQSQPADALAVPERAMARAWSLDRIIGTVLFATVLVLNMVFLVGGRPQSGPLPMAKVLLHWPAVLVVIGGTIALALFMGAGAGARAWTLGFALTGVVGLLVGLIQALFGFVHRNIGEVAAACAFIISASSFSLLGLVTVAAPLEDREVMEGRRTAPAPLSRLFWAVFPLVTFIFLLMTFVMVVTPMTKPAG